MRRPSLIIAGLIFGLAITNAGAVHAERRVALVIGNSAYKNAPALANPKNDATDMAAALHKIGVEVIEGVDLNKSELEQKIRAFSEALRGAEVGVFFYAGHGLQVNGNNYLVPIDASLLTAAALEFEMVRLDAVQRLMENAAKTNILFIDACRNNPLSRNLARAMGTRAAAIGRGLAPAESGVGTLISYSTQPGNVALDGTGRNSPYAGPLVSAITVQGEDVLTVLTKVRNEVLAATGDQQVPWENHALRARFYFNGEKPPEPQPVAVTPTQSNDAERAWATIQSSSSVVVLEGFRKQFGGANPFYDSLAASRIAALNDAAEAAKKKSEQAATTTAALAPVPPAANPADKTKLVRDLQSELKRVGCADAFEAEVWGSKSKLALTEFSRITKLAVSIDEPTQAALDALTSQKVRVCPVKCGKGQIEMNGACTAVPKPEREATRHVEHTTRAATPAPEQKSKGPRYCMGLIVSDGVGIDHCQ